MRITYAARYPNKNMADKMLGWLMDEGAIYWTDNPKVEQYKPNRWAITLDRRN